MTALFRAKTKLRALEKFKQIRLGVASAGAHRDADDAEEYEYGSPGGTVGISISDHLEAPFIQSRRAEVGAGGERQAAGDGAGPSEPSAAEGEIRPNHGPRIGSEQAGGASITAPVPITPETTRLIGEEQEEQAAPGWFKSSKELLLGSPIYIFLLAIPVALITGATHGPPGVVFASNLVSLIPLALLLSEITEDLALQFGYVIGGLINASFGNVVEVVLSLAALRRGLLTVVSTSLLGSILGNLLLVTGASFLVGGLVYRESTFNAFALRIYSSLLFLACVGFSVPSIYKLCFEPLGSLPTAALLAISRWTAVALLASYACYLFFQLVTHKDLFNGDNENGNGNGRGSRSRADAVEPPQGAAELASGQDPGHPGPHYPGRVPPGLAWGEAPPGHLQLEGERSGAGAARAKGSVARRAESLRSGHGLGVPSSHGPAAESPQPQFPLPTADAAAAAGVPIDRDRAQQPVEKPETRFSRPVAFLWLVAITLLVAVCSEYLTGSIEEVSKQYNVSQAFLGMIVLPIAGNAAEHVTAVLVAAKGKIDLSLAVALGSSIQIALLAIPLAVLAGWAMGQPFTLAFDPFSLGVVVLSVLHADRSLNDAQSNWLLGLMLLVTYAIIAITYYLGTFTLEPASAIVKAFTDTFPASLVQGSAGGAATSGAGGAAAGHSHGGVGSLVSWAAKGLSQLMHACAEVASKCGHVLTR